MTFQAGISGNPSGKPKGTKNKNTWKDLQYLWEKLEAEIDKIESPTVKAEKIQEYISSVVAKLKDIPLPSSTPEESVSNANKLFEEAVKNVQQSIQSSNIGSGLETKQSDSSIQANSTTISPKVEDK